MNRKYYTANASAFQVKNERLPAKFPKLPFGEQFRIFPLAQDLENADRNGVGKVEAARLRDHRNPHACVGVFMEQRLGQTFRFLAENEVAILRIANVGMNMAGFGGKIIGNCGEKLFKRELKKLRLQCVTI